MTVETDAGGRLQALTGGARVRLRAAAEELKRIEAGLAARGSNPVAEVLAGVESYYEWDHYPAGDVYDPRSHAQFYYHSHNGAAGEHGHFHTFLRARGMPGGALPDPCAPAWPAEDEAICHFVAVSMDLAGRPTHLFTTNRWVTGESFYAARQAIALLDRFSLDVSGRASETGRWLTALLTLFRPQVEELLLDRDRVLRAKADRLGWSFAEICEDRTLEIPSICEIDVDAQLAAMG